MGEWVKRDRRAKLIIGEKAASEEKSMNYGLVRFGEFRKLTKEKNLVE